MRLNARLNVPIDETTTDPAVWASALCDAVTDFPDAFRKPEDFEGWFRTAMQAARAEQREEWVAGLSSGRVGS